jgi:hypothetical protein
VIFLLWKTPHLVEKENGILHLHILCDKDFGLSILASRHLI